VKHRAGLALNLWQELVEIWDWPVLFPADLPYFVITWSSQLVSGETCSDSVLALADTVATASSPTAAVTC
jgi:hypothetical protein